jgi:putative membrane protein
VRVAVGAILCLLPFRPLAAHGLHAVAPDAVWRSWNIDPNVLVPLILALWGYGRGVRHLWSRAGRGHGVANAHTLSFTLGTTALLIALVSPLDRLGETLLSAHMAQHGLLVAVAPPLLLLGRPGAVWAWALPPRWRGPLLGSALWRRLARWLQVVSRPLPAAALHGAALWLWHAPAAFDAAVANHAVHALEHVSFLGTALVFWHSVLGARSGRRAAAALGASFATLLHGGLLGALVTLAPYPLYGWYRGRTEPWGLSALEDQQLAGLVMWVPMGATYLAACLLLAGRFVALRAERAGEQ